ncbi:Cro/Cl family transcriptional regulator [Asticcacaulis sp. AC460]|nr:Cro/Cl family transcriptional regulator [Asticcacaulis sp. AC460]
MDESRVHPIDVHVGSRVRMRRKFMGISQQVLGDSIGLTFQQVQKYERGSNRISASKLWHIGQVLKVPIDYFFDGFAGGEDPQDAPGGTEAAINAFLTTSEGIELAEVFPKVSGPKLRRKVLDLVKALADDAET